MTRKEVGESVKIGFYAGDIRYWLRHAGFSNIIVGVIPSLVDLIDFEKFNQPGQSPYIVAIGTA